MGEMRTKARYEQGILRPLSNLDLKEGEEVEIEVKKRKMFGMLQGWNEDPQRLKDELREIHG
jgi:predicted DNA-binding antitoxin AbrB/MazE fold protein